jgi:glycosyltransferase involved in cell wall biosynthesis
MLFSILIANYNNGHFFKDCYESIIKQTYPNWEVIIVDDASTDNSVEIIKSTIKNDSRFRLLHNEVNKGCGFTKRECAKRANGSLLGFLDSDDALKPHALKRMVEIHDKFNQVSIVTSRFELVDLQLNFIENGANGSKIPDGKSYLTFGKGALTAFASFKNSAYKKTEGINPLMKRAVDQDLYYKMEEQGCHFFLDDILYLYRINENSISNNQNLYKARYWHFYATKKAYYRRKKHNFKIDNFTSQYFKNYESNYFLSRFELSKKTNKFSSKLYHLFKAIAANPLHRLKFKMKSLILLIIGRI